MAKVQFKQTIDVLETLKTFEVLDSLKFQESDIKIGTFRQYMYNFFREKQLEGTFNVVKLPNNEFLVTRTA